MFEWSQIAAIIIIATFINIIATIISWQRRRTKDGQYFALGMVGVTIWMLASALDHAAISIPLKIFFVKWEVVGYSAALTCFTLFVLSYCGYEVWLSKSWVRIVFAAIPTVNSLLVWTNEFHGWVWTGVIRGESAVNAVVFQRGPAVVWVAFTGYLMIFLILINLWLASRRGPVLARRQARLLFLGALFPLAANLLNLNGISGGKGVDWTPVSFALTDILFLYALYGARLLDLVPVAHERVVASLSDGMIVLDLENRIIDINRSAVNMLQSTAEVLTGKTLSDVIPQIQSLPELASAQETRAELAFGEEPKRYFDVLISLLYEDSQEVVGRLIIIRDITERKEKELRLLQLTQVIEQSPTSVMITEPNGKIAYVNPRLALLTGYASEEVIGKDPSIMQSGQTPDEIYRDMWNSIQSGHTWHGEFLNRKKNGELYWEDAVIAPVMDPQGKIINFIASKVDITARKDAEQALRLSEERFRQLVTSAPDAVFGIDGQGSIVFANNEAARLLGYNEDELIGRSVEVLVPEVVRGQHIQYRDDYSFMPRTRSMAVGRELAARRKDGSNMPVEINLSHSLTENGPLIIAHMRDITSRKAAEDALRSANQTLESQLKEIESLQATLREQAVRDPLTQLHNRRYLNEAIEREFHHAGRTSQPLSIILFDIDHFKTINDTFGHLAGDTCLVALAQLIQRHIRKSDISCRYGGEEFLLLLPATSVEGAAQYAERLRRTVANEVLKVDGRDVKFTISVGIASYPDHGTTYTEVVNKADDALYVSKNTGRNRVTVWAP